MKLKFSSNNILLIKYVSASNHWLNIDSLNKLSFNVKSDKKILSILIHTDGFLMYKTRIYMQWKSLKYTDSFHKYAKWFFYKLIN